jgi:hypothetical protein
MSPQPATLPVEDSVPKVAGDVSVGEDLEFQRKWWKFENFIWFFFLLILVCDVLGLFGRGWLAKAHAETPDHALTLDYERIERAGTPSVMTLNFNSAAIHDGKIQFFISDSIVKPLGAQRISPQPRISAVGDGGITYTFDATQAPATIQIALEPSFPGAHSFRLQLPGEAPIDAKVIVLP